MDAPFGIIFLRKAELYSLLKDQWKQALIMKNRHRKSPNPITWYVEEKILKWTYHGHKYLYATINTSDFKLEGSNKLKDWELLDNNGKIKDMYDDHVKKSIEMCIEQPNAVLSNMVARGFAEYFDEKKNSIIINKDGLLFGEIIYNVEEENSIYTYKIFSFLMGLGGAWILLILFALTIIITIIIPLLLNSFNIYIQLIKWFISSLIPLLHSLS